MSETLSGFVPHRQRKTGLRVTGLGPGPPLGFYYEPTWSSVIPHTFSCTLASAGPCFPHMLSHVSSCIANDFFPYRRRQDESKLETNKA